MSVPTGTLLVIEILSPEDSYSETQVRVSDYLRMGVGTVWIIDTRTRTGRMCIGDVWRASSYLEVPGTSLYVNLSEMFGFLGKPTV